MKTTSSVVRDFISKIQNHLDVAQQASLRLTGRSETFGAIQQEERVSRAFEVMLLYVDHLKRLFDKEHKELGEARKFLYDTYAFKKDFRGESVTEDQKKYLNSIGLPLGTIRSVGRRRASVADFNRRSLPDSFRPPNLSQSWTSGCAVQNSGTQRYESSSFLTASSQGVSSSSLPTSPVTIMSSSRIHTLGTSGRRSSLPVAHLPVPRIVSNPEPASDQSNQRMSALYSDKQSYRNKERNSWTRKLSAVRDEREQSEDEMESLDIYSFVNYDNETETEKRRVRLSFLNYIESERNGAFETYDEEFDDFDASETEEFAYLPFLWNSFGDWPYSSAISDIESRIAYICYIIYIWGLKSMRSFVHFISGAIFICSVTCLLIAFFLAW